MNKRECIELINDFVDDWLYGDINYLHEFDLSEIKDDEKYGMIDSNLTESDPDNTVIANAIYTVVWDEIIPDLSFDNLGSGKKYRGETLNSYNTLFGKPKEIYYEGKPVGLSFMNYTSFESIKIENEKLSMRVCEFYERYHNIGNMMPLPNKSIITNGANTLNSYKGVGVWHDYCDIFLVDLHKVLIKDSNSDEGIDEKLKQLVNVNNNFFNNYHGKDGFEKFINDFYLDCYYDSESSSIKNLFSPHEFHWSLQMKKMGEDEYFNTVIPYIETCDKIIEYRCNCIINKLKQVLY
ncbi:hypothetical protein LJB88_04760 [Erysipelotrichaceae bacterium OttesenSCG-928-M19]|nr:hypothetical protein [Erysipelotrichaceae bacterium OttesenSCG-928-M19]